MWRTSVFSSQDLPIEGDTPVAQSIKPDKIVVKPLRPVGQRGSTVMVQSRSHPSVASSLSPLAGVDPRLVLIRRLTKIIYDTPPDLQIHIERTIAAVREETVSHPVPLSASISSQSE